MKRSVRNGLAIVGMAGGLLFLGQAMANASEDGATANNGASTSSTASGTGSGDTDADNDTTNANLAADVKANVVDTDETNTGNAGTVENGSGDNQAVLEEPVKEEEPAPEELKTAGTENGSTPEGSEVVFDTGNKTELDITSGDVSGSSSPVVGNGPGGGATANNDLDTDANASGSGSGSGDTEADNDTTNVNGAIDADVNVVETGGINTGNIILVENNSGGNTAYCPEGGCTIYFNTGNKTFIVVHSGSVSNSNNPVVGNSGWPGSDRGDGKRCGCDKASQAKKTAAPVAHRAAPKLSSAQPKGELAFTGAETSLPLAVGLLALGAGGALTLAGRRRETATA
jgi:hypothetical protein